MSITLQWIEGNKYAAWLIDPNNDIHVFLGYHYEYTVLPLERIQANLEAGLNNAFNIVRKSTLKATGNGG